VAAAPDRDRQAARLREPNGGPDVGYAGSPPSRNMNIANCAKPTLTKEPSILQDRPRWRITLYLRSAVMYYTLFPLSL